MKPQSAGASLRIAKHRSTKSAIVSKRGLRKLVDGTVVVLETFRHHCVSLCRGCMMVCACISGVYVTTTRGGGHYSPKPHSRTNLVLDPGGFAWSPRAVGSLFHPVDLLSPQLKNGKTRPCEIKAGGMAPSSPLITRKTRRTSAFCGYPKTKTDSSSQQPLPDPW